MQKKIIDFEVIEHKREKNNKSEPNGKFGDIACYSMILYNKKMVFMVMDWIIDYFIIIKNSS